VREHLEATRAQREALHAAGLTLLADLRIAA